METMKICWGFLFVLMKGALLIFIHNEPVFLVGAKRYDFSSHGDSMVEAVERLPDACEW